METVTVVDLSEKVEIRHEHNFASDSVTLVFRESGELAVTCTPDTLTRLAQAVTAAEESLEEWNRNHAGLGQLAP